MAFTRMLATGPYQGVSDGRVGNHRGVGDVGLANAAEIESYRFLK